ncbi:MAG: LysM domain-containing protein [Chloroflexi bacterium]|nr:LysM domain-containing protein [Chloroflexota bacterium]
MVCANCGATIADIAVEETASVDDRAESPYDHRYGETDLAEESLGRRGRILSAALVVSILVAILGAAALLLPSRVNIGGAGVVQSRTPTSTRIAGPSVTPGPPTATVMSNPAPTAPPTDTLTPAPCRRRVAAGDSLIGIISGCGHRGLEILPTVMQLNGIQDRDLLLVGQEIIVPLPSPTRDPAAPVESTAASEIDAAALAPTPTVGISLLAFDPFAPTETPTLLPGLMWHVVQPGENMIAIALRYKTDAKALSDLNPEIEFLLCEFGEAFGGPECTVNLFQSQLIRVPAPTPTVTPIPTASGSETPTPTPTATFNAPIAQSPPNGAFIAPFEPVTLRWVATGRLGADDFYRIVLSNAETGMRYTADTRELFFIIPEDWGPQDSDSHQFSWRISVYDADAGLVSHASAERNFLWQGSGQANQ